MVSLSTCALEVKVLKITVCSYVGCGLDPEVNFVLCEVCVCERQYDF